MRLGSMVLIVMVWGLQQSAAAAEIPWHVEISQKLAGTTGGNTLLFDDSARRLYVGTDDHVLVLDQYGDQTSSLPVEQPGNISLAVPMRTGFVVDQKTSNLAMFDLTGQTPLVEIPLDFDAAPITTIAFEPSTARLFAFADKRAMIVDPVDRKLEATIVLEGSPAASLADGSGRLFYTLKDLNRVDVIDARRNATSFRWSTGEQCDHPGALAIDPLHHHLFVACENNRFIVMDSDFGAVEDDFATEKPASVIIYDADLNRALAAVPGHVLTVGPGDDGHYGVLATSPAMPGASLLALDARDHRLFSVVSTAADPASSSTGQTLLTMTRQP